MSSRNALPLIASVLILLGLGGCAAFAGVSSCKDHDCARTGRPGDGISF